MERNRNRRRTLRCRLLSFMRLEERQVMDGVGFTFTNDEAFFASEFVSPQSFAEIRHIEHNEVAERKSTKSWWQFDSLPRGHQFHHRSFERHFYAQDAYFGLIGEGEFSPRSSYIEFEPVIRAESSPSSAKVIADSAPAKPITVVQLIIQPVTATVNQTHASVATVTPSQSSTQSTASNQSTVNLSNNSSIAKLIPASANRNVTGAPVSIQAPLIGANWTPSAINTASTSALMVEQNRDIATRSFHNAQATLNPSVNATHDALIFRSFQKQLGPSDAKLTSSDRTLQRSNSEKSALPSNRDRVATTQFGSLTRTERERNMNSTAEALQRWSDANFVEFAGLDAMEIMHQLDHLSGESANGRDSSQEPGGFSNAVCWFWVAAGSSVATAVIDSWSRSRKRQKDSDSCSVIEGTSPQIMAYTNIWSSHDRFID